MQAGPEFTFRSFFMSFTAQKMFFTRGQRIQQALFIILVVTVVISSRYLSSDRHTTTLAVHPEGVMGTSCTLCITVPNSKFQHANELLKEAEQEIRRWEQYTSTWIETSEVSRFNRAKAGEEVKLSPRTLQFFCLSRKAFDETHGAFDITCGALWNFWAQCEKENRLPDVSEIENIRTESNWKMLELRENSVLKHSGALSVVSGGISKGMAIDAALKVLTSDGSALSAFVEIGGDVATYRCEEPIFIENPNYDPKSVLSETNLKYRKTLTFPDGGVCTSGHNARYFTIQGKKYSQILDPRTGQPVPKRGNITVFHRDAATADYWATALEVLGKDGFSLCPRPCSIDFTDYEEKMEP